MYAYVCVCVVTDKVSLGGKKRVCLGGWVCVWSDLSELKSMCACGFVCTELGHVSLIKFLQKCYPCVDGSIIECDLVELLQTS